MNISYYTVTSNGPAYYEIEIGDALTGFLLNRTPPEVKSLFTYAFDSQYSTQIRRELDALLAVKRPDGAPSMNHFAIRRGEEPLVSYTPYGKQLTINADGTWSRDGRQSMKPGRWIRALFNADALKRFNITDDILGQLTQGVNAYCTTQDVLQVVKGDDIVHYYDVRSYSTDAGDDYTSDSGNNLWRSCMRYSKYGKQGFFELYSKSPNCSMLVALRDGAVSGRALVWSNVDAVLASCDPYDAPLYPKEKRITDRITFMDRVYTIEPKLQEAFIAYAQDHGWYYKMRQSFEYWHHVCSPDGAKMTARMQVESGITECNPANLAVNWPYADTFCFIAGDGVLRNYNSYHTVAALWSTSGSLQQGRNHGSSCGDPFKEISTVAMVDTALHGMVPEESVTTCRVCMLTGDASMMPLVMTVDDGYANYCMGCRAAALRDGTLVDIGGNYLIPRECAVQILDIDYTSTSLVHRDNAVYSEYHNSYIRRGQARNVMPYGVCYWHVVYKEITGSNIPSWSTEGLVVSVWHGRDSALDVYIAQQDARWVCSTNDWIHKDHLYDYLRNHKEARWAVLGYDDAQAGNNYYTSPITPRKVTYRSLQRVISSYGWNPPYSMGEVAAGIQFSYGLTVEDMDEYTRTHHAFQSGYRTMWATLERRGGRHPNAVCEFPTTETV